MSINPLNKHGFTLVEVLVTLVILAVGLLASVVGIMTALDHNLMNEMRNEAIKIAQEQQEAARTMTYAAIPQIPATQTIGRQVRKTTVPYTVKLTLTQAANTAPTMGAWLVDFTVFWNFKTKSKMMTYQYDLQTIVRQAQ